LLVRRSVREKMWGNMLQRSKSGRLFLRDAAGNSESSALDRNRFNPAIRSAADVPGLYHCPWVVGHDPVTSLLYINNATELRSQHSRECLFHELCQETTGRSSDARITLLVSHLNATSPRQLRAAHQCWPEHWKALDPLRWKLRREALCRGEDADVSLTARSRMRVIRRDLRICWLAVSVHNETPHIELLKRREEISHASITPPSLDDSHRATRLCERPLPSARPRVRRVNASKFFGPAMACVAFRGVRART